MVKIGQTKMSENMIAVNVGDFLHHLDCFIELAGML